MSFKNGMSFEIDALFEGSLLTFYDIIFRY